MTMLEKAARAAYESPHGPNRLWSDLTHTGKQLAINQVRAVLMAVREPDEAMSAAARTTEGWEAMIDAILNEVAQ